MKLEQPQLAKQLVKAIGDTPRHVIAAEIGVSPAALTMFITGGQEPKHQRVRQALSKLITERS